MITHIFGKPKKGKTALLTYFAMQNMFGENAKNALRASGKITEKYNALGYQLTMPDKHLLYSNYDIKGYSKGLPPRVNHYTNGWQIGFVNDNFYTACIPPNATICLTEAQEYYDCHKAEPCDAVSLWYARHGHFKINIFMDTQRYDGLHKNIRDLTEVFIEVLDMHVSRGLLGLKTVWSVRIYDGIKDLENYKATGNKRFCDSKKIVFNGNIFNCYNAFECAAQFLDRRYNDDYIRGQGAQKGETLYSLFEYNQQRAMTAPKGFYVSKGGRK